MNGPNYAALLGFAQGNLVEISSYEVAKGDAKPKEPQRTKFNPAFQFAPPKDDFPTFRMTANIPQVTVSGFLCEASKICIGKPELIEPLYQQIWQIETPIL